jgi:hypothetical protein
MTYKQLFGIDELGENQFIAAVLTADIVDAYDTVFTSEGLRSYLANNYKRGSKLPITYLHSADAILGRVLDLKMFGNKLYALAELDPDPGLEVVESKIKHQIQKGTEGFSIHFRNSEEKYDQKRGTWNIAFKRIVEIAFTPLPAVPGTGVTLSNLN